MGNNNLGDEVHKIFDGLGAPCSMKERAALRCRRIPHVWMQLNDRNAYEIANVRPLATPVFRFPDGLMQSDSAPLIFELENRHKNGRSGRPDDETRRFFSLPPDTC